MPMIDTDDSTRIHYEWSGHGDAPVVMLSSSLGTDLGMWEPQMPALRERFRVLRYDMRGHGASDVPAGPYALDRLGRDALALLDHLEIGRAHFCGLSLGGMIGMWLAARHPDRIGRLALCNTSARMGTVESWNDRMAKVEQGGMAAITPAVLARWFMPRTHEDHPATVEAIRLMLLGNPPEGYAACCAAIRDADLRETLAGIAAPALVVAGTHDLAAPPEDGRLIASAIPGAAYIELDAAHLSNQEAPEAFTSQVVEFLGA